MNITWADIAALLAGLGAIATAILMYRKSLILLEEQMKEVKDRLNSHNKYAEKFTEAKTDISEIKTDIAVIKTTLAFIQKEVDDGK